MESARVVLQRTLLQEHPLLLIQVINQKSSNKADRQDASQHQGDKPDLDRLPARCAGTRRRLGRLSRGTLWRGWFGFLPIELVSHRVEALPD